MQVSGELRQRHKITLDFDGPPAGGGRAVWPWSATDLGKIAPNSTGLTSPAWSFDGSELAQREIVFEHMQKKGINRHFPLQETEKGQLLNGGGLGAERMLHMRARTGGPTRPNAPAS
jgi:hypothetical protein